MNAPTTPRAGRREWVGLAVIALPCLLYSMDLTVLFLAVPHISADLRPSSTQLLWITDVYGFLLAGLLVEVALLALLGLTTAFWVAVGLLVVWGLSAAATLPIRQTYLNGLIPSAQRATVLSFDNLLGSSGGVVIQPALGKVADVAGYATSYQVAAGIQALATPFVVLARRTRAPSDPVEFEPVQQGG